LVDENGKEVRLSIWGQEKADKFVDKFDITNLIDKNK
jgi:hypothetical protein